MAVISPPPPSTSLLLSAESNIPALPLDIVMATQLPPESPPPQAPSRHINTILPIPTPAVVAPVTQDEPTVQILTSPPSPVSNPTSALPSPSPIIISPTPAQQHEPQASTSTTASQAPPQPRQSQSTFRHVGPLSTAGGRPYTHSPLRPAHRGTSPLAGPSAAPGTAGNATVFRTLSSSTGNTPAVLSPSLSPSPHVLSPRIFTLSQQTRTSSPLASCNVSTPTNNGSLPVIPIPIGQRGESTPLSSRLASPVALPTPAGASSPSSSPHTMEAPQPPSKGPTPSPTPSTSQKVLPQTPPSRPVSLHRHPGHTPTHSNTLPVQLPSSTPTSRSATPAPTPPQRASGSAPYRAGFQPKGMYRSHTDEFLESRARKRENGRVEQRRLERRLDKVCSIRHTRASFSSITFMAILIYLFILLLFYYYLFYSGALY